MTTKISPRDWETLSAYIDEQLAPRERSQLETRLKDDPGLRAALQELRRTRIVLRSQPKLRAPRNFTLTPQMAGLRAARRSMPGAYPFLRLASALATIFFVIAFFGEIAVRTFQPAPLVMSREAQQQAIQNAWRPFGMGGGGGGGDEAPAAAVEAPVAEAPAEPLAEEGALKAESEILTGAATGPSQEKLETATPAGGAADEAAQITETSTAMDMASSSAIEGTSIPEGIGGEQPPTPTAQAVAQAAQAQPWPLLRTLQICLILLALVTGIAAFYMRRTQP